MRRTREAAGTVAAFVLMRATTRSGRFPHARGDKNAPMDHPLWVRCPGRAGDPWTRPDPQFRFPSGADATSQGSTLVRKRLELGTSLYQMLQIVSLTLFEKAPILCALQTIDPDANFAENLNQLILFDF